MAVLDQLPPTLAETLSRFPARGERNLWLFTVAAQARHIASPAKVQRFLHRIVSHAGWTDRDFSREITRAVTRAFNPACPAKLGPAERSGAERRRAKPASFPPFDPSLWDRFVSTPPLFNPDPSSIQDPIPGAVVLDHLYAPDALLCLGLSVRSAITQPRSAWRGLEPAIQFIVANPMVAVTGLTQDGRPSHRCHGNATRSRIYQVVEFDRGTLPEQAALLTALHSATTPLILVVWSGGKSLHGWFDVRHLPEPDKLRFFAAACRLGADPSLWDPCKLVRMPGGRRANNNAQPILYFPHAT